VGGRSVAEGRCAVADPLPEPRVPFACVHCPPAYEPGAVAQPSRR
jgi:hypothetical protein